MKVLILMALLVSGGHLGAFESNTNLGTGEAFCDLNERLNLKSASPPVEEKVVAKEAAGNDPDTEDEL